MHRQRQAAQALQVRRKVSVTTTLKPARAGSSPSQALPGNPYDGHTLGRIIPAIEQLLGNTIERLHVDAGYRGHNAPTDPPIERP